MSVKVSFTIDSCGDCEHPHHLINFDFTICSHPGHKRNKENARITKHRGGSCHIVYMNEIPSWCPLRKGKPYRME